MKTKKERMIDFMDALSDYIEVKVDGALSYRECSEYGGNYREIDKTYDELENKLNDLLGE